MRPCNYVCDCSLFISFIRFSMYCLGLALPPPSSPLSFVFVLYSVLCEFFTISLYILLLLFSASVPALALKNDDPTLFATPVGAVAVAVCQSTGGRVLKEEHGFNRVNSQLPS
jgi:hypothetical protein